MDMSVRDTPPSELANEEDQNTGASSSIHGTQNLQVASPIYDDLWHLPGQLRINPYLWDKADVSLWLQWAHKEYSLRQPEDICFEMNGRALCLLTKEDFKHRCPNSGDVLYEILQCVINKRRSVVAEPKTEAALQLYSNNTQDKTERLIEEPLNLTTQVKSQTQMHKADGRLPECRLLYDYVYKMLCDDHYQEYIRWEDRGSLVFRIVDPNGLARLWGHHKNRDNMTYEKMSRALRHYSKLNIIKKERGQRLLFRFLKTPQEIRKDLEDNESPANSPLRDTAGSPSEFSKECFQVSPDRSSSEFSPTGFLATYQLGVAQCFLQNAPWILNKAPWILGASAGSLVAAAVACEIDLISIRNEVLDFAKVMKNSALGPLNPSVHILQWLKYVLHKYLPNDAHLLSNGRLAVAMTRLDNGQYTVITEYQSKDDVIQALLCSCYVPGYCGMLPPSLNGVHYMDGGFSRIQPVLALPDQTLTISPFSGETDICPSDNPCMMDMVVTGLILKGNLANGLRFLNALYPNKLETVEQAYHSGYKDAYQFLLRNELASNMKMFKMSQGFDKYSCTKIPTLLETSPENKNDDEITTLQDSKSRQMMASDEHQTSTAKLTVTELPLTFDSAKNIMMGQVTMYWSMLGPSGSFTYLMLPVMLLFQILVETTQIVEVLLKKAPERAFWTWCGLRQLAVFFFGIMISTFKKNLKASVLSVMEPLKQTQNEVLQKQSRPPNRKFPSPAQSETVRCGGLRAIPPLRGL
ncbi:uncharacterized protein LOC144192397 [Stigmatopora nigra]